MRKLTIALLICLLAALPAMASDLLRLNPDGVAIDGYSPVSYFENGKAEPGSAEFSATHDGATYWFTSEEQRQLFLGSPQSYLPAHGGWCSLMLSGSGNRAVANPESWIIVDGKLLMFWSGTFKDMEISGLKNWHSKTGGSDEKALGLLEKADKTWDAIQRGKKKGQIVLFSETDGELMTESQRAGAKKNY